eukprot:403375820
MIQIQKASKQSQGSLIVEKENKSIDQKDSESNSEEEKEKLNGLDQNILEFDLMTKDVIQIEGIKVKFPNVPYNVQVDYMTQAVKAIKNNKFAALDMPTGTGKTLSLLSSTLAFIETMKKLDPIKYRNLKLIYTSRTHSQLSQVKKEMRKSPYQYFKSATVASRDKYCLQEQLVQEFKGNDLRKECQKLRSKNQIKVIYDEILQKEQKIVVPQCQYYKMVPVNRISVHKVIAAINHIDIEDLCIAGKEQKICPYYSSFQKAKSSDILFLPYNYILDIEMIVKLDLDLTQCIIVIDEGHNFTQSCKDASQFILTTGEIINSRKELKIIKSYWDQFEAMSIDVPMFQRANQNDVEEAGNVITQLDQYMKFNRTIRDPFQIQVEDQNNTFLNKTILHQKSLKQYLTYQSVFKGISSIEKLSFTFTKSEVSDHYIWIKDPEQDMKKFKSYQTLQNEEQQDLKEMHLYCFNAAFIFKDIQNLNPFSLILTSGSLGEISTIASELGTNFDFTLSYEKLKYFKDFWSKKLYLTDILQKKNLYQESSFKHLNDQTIESYLSDMRTLDQQTKKNGAVLFAVFRGNFSEGYDFSDYDARYFLKEFKAIKVNKLIKQLMGKVGTNSRLLQQQIKPLEERQDIKMILVQLFLRMKDFL